MIFFEWLEYSFRVAKGCNPLLQSQGFMRVVDVHAIALVKVYSLWN